MISVETTLNRDKQMSTAPDFEKLQTDIVQPDESAPVDFLHEVKYEYAHGEVTAHGETSKYTVAVPLGELASSDMVIYLNGLGAFKKTTRHVRNSTANEGSAALSSAPIRRSDRSIWQKLSNPTGLHVDHLTAVLDDLPNNTHLRDETENGSRLDFTQFNLACHSYGGKIGVEYALRHPDDVKNLVLIKPVGHEDPGVHRFHGRIGPFTRKELLPFLMQHDPDLSIRDAGRAFKHIGQSPSQMVGEIIACLTADHRNDLLTIGDLMGVAIITGSKDNLIPAKPIEEFSADMVHHYVKLDTNHLGPQNQPRIVARAVTETIRELDTKRANGTLEPLIISRLLARLQAVPELEQLS